MHQLPDLTAPSWPVSSVVMRHLIRARPEGFINSGMTKSQCEKY
jgi:hypothetical protein